MSDIKVSICCLAYNHEPYMRQCLDGFIMQKTNFDFEVLIHDDASSDKTADIIREYEKKYPKVIKPVYQTENQYSKGIGVTLKFNFPRAKGKYIAMCEGDDYWTDPLKLQKQVDFLENNPEYVMCSHDAFKKDEMGNGETGERLVNSDKEFDITTADLIVKNRASTLTVMFRNFLIKEFPVWFPGFSGGDRPLYILLSELGKLKYLPFVGATYRMHAKGVSSSYIYGDHLKKINHLKVLIKFHKILDIHFKGKYKDIIEKCIIENSINLFRYYFRYKIFKEATSLVRREKLYRHLSLKDHARYIICWFSISKQSG